MLNASLQALAAALADKQVSSVELTQAALDRIAARNADINAFVHVDPEGALAMDATATFAG